MALISFPQALRLWADRDPERPAITDAERTVTRGELERRTNRLARAYAALGVTPGPLRDHRASRTAPNSSRRWSPSGSSAPRPSRSRGACRPPSARPSSSWPIRRWSSARRSPPSRVGPRCRPASSPTRRWHPTRCPDRVATCVEGADVGRQHGPSEAHRRRHAGDHRPRCADAVPHPARRSHGDAGSALPQRPVRRRRVSDCFAGITSCCCRGSTRSARSRPSHATAPTGSIWCRP